MEALAKYLDANGIKPFTLAERLGCEPSTITRILKGQRKPSVDLARRIFAETGVPVEQLRPDIFGAPEAA